MNKALGIALLVVGVILLIWGINASESVGSQISETFTGKPTDKTIWMIIGGVVSGLTGLGLLLFTGSRPSGPA
jgi:uncharacterized membrane protein YidH (DUF202 family)